PLAVGNDLRAQLFCIGKSLPFLDRPLIWGDRCRMSAGVNIVVGMKQEIALRLSRSLQPKSVRREGSMTAPVQTTPAVDPAHFPDRCTTLLWYGEFMGASDAIERISQLLDSDMTKT